MVVQCPFMSLDFYPQGGVPLGFGHDCVCVIDGAKTHIPKSVKLPSSVFVIPKQTSLPELEKGANVQKGYAQAGGTSSSEKERVQNSGSALKGSRVSVFEGNRPLKPLSWNLLTIRSLEGGPKYDESLRV